MNVIGKDVMESFIETWKALKQKRNVDIMLKELKIETLQSENT
jgi:hypothetical protein